jgi:hypothetical protein
MQIGVDRAILEDVDALARMARWIDNGTTGRPGVAFFVADLDGEPAGYSVGGP